jgi:hypothetical protein
LRRIGNVILAAAFASVLVWTGCGQNLGSSSAPYNQGGQQAGGTSQFGRQVAPGERGAGGAGVSGGSTLTLGIKVTAADVTAKDSPFGGGATGFVKWVRDKGFGAIGIYGVEPTSEPDKVAKFYFDDVPFTDGTKLSDYGYAAGGNTVKEIADAAKQSGIGVQVDLTRFALSLGSSPLVSRQFAGKPLTAEQIARVCSYLVDTVQVDSVTGRGFPDDWVREAGRVCKAAGKQFFAGDLAGLRRAESGAATLLDLSPEVLVRNELALGQARTQPYMLWAGVSGERDFGRDSPFTAAWASLKEFESALIYRTVLSSPAGLFLDVSPATVDKLGPDVIQKLKDYAAMRRPKPVCSVVLVGDKLPRNMTAIVNGITAAGYEIVVGAAPKQGAQADAFYVIVTPDADGKMPDPASALPDSVTTSGKPVVLHVCGPIPELGLSAGWDAVRRAFGLGDAAIEASDKGPKEADYNGTGLPCFVSGGVGWGVKLTRGALHGAEAVVVAAKSPARSSEASPSPAPSPAPPETPDPNAPRTEPPSPGVATAAQTGSPKDEVVISATRYGQNGRNILIAGAELAPEMAWPISNLLSGGLGLQAPTRVLCSVGSPIALFSPGEDGHVTLRYKELAEEKTINQDVKKGEVVIVEVKNQSAVNTLPLPDRPKGD